MLLCSDYSTVHLIEKKDRVGISIVIGVGPMSSSSIQLSATGRLLDNTSMCYEFRTPLLPGPFRQPKQSDLSVTSTLQSVNRWRHNEYSCCPHPLPLVQLWGASVVKVRLVVWRSDLIGEGGPMCAGIIIIWLIWERLVLKLTNISSLWWLYWYLLCIH